MSKRCTCCKLIKTLSHFFIDQHSPTGRQARCKRCNKCRNYDHCVVTHVTRGALKEHEVKVSCPKNDSIKKNVRENVDKCVTKYYLNGNLVKEKTKFFSN